MFNWYGYRIITNYFQLQADGQLAVKLDSNHYSDAQLIELRVELNVPYQNNQTEFERHYGEILIDGKYYTYVKRKIENGYLIVKCIPNNAKDKIKAVGDEFVKLVAGVEQDHQNNKKNTTYSFAKNFWSDYDDQLTGFTLSIYQQLITQPFNDYPSALYSTTQSCTEHPPDETLAV